MTGPMLTQPENDDDQSPYDEDEDDGRYPGDECGRWRNGRLVAQCLKAGSEECDWECPYAR